MARWGWLIAYLCAASGALASVTCEDITFEDTSFSICKVDVSTADLRMFLRDDAGEVIGQFRQVNSLLTDAKARLSFAMNAGMYHDDRAPVGLYVEDGAQEQRLITSAGPGNFGLLPNGVFCITKTQARVFETKRFADENPQCTYASQSGPMLVIDGALHPRFLADGTSKYIRNGVGTNAQGSEAVFAISNQPVNFHLFGRLFRDHLRLPNALYFDGNISRLYAPQLGRSDIGFQLGPIVGVVEKLP